MRYLVLLLLVLLAPSALAHRPDVINLTNFVVSLGDLSDATAATATEIVGLGIPVLAAKNYAIKCYLLVDNAGGTGEGIQIGATGPATVTQMSASYIYYASATTLAVEAFEGTTFPFESAATASAGTADTINQLQILLENGATAGVVQITFNPENATSARVFANSWCEYQVLN